VSEPSRKGARSRAAIPADTLRALNAGTFASANLVEGLAVDFAALLRAVAPEMPGQGVAAMQAAAGQGVTRRMALAAELLLREHGVAGAAALAAHPSDTVRGWAAFMLGGAPGLAMAQRLSALRGLADDAHFAVREWAWLALRPHVVAEPLVAIALLRPWTMESSDNLRRFAVEATRPRGVWAAHIGLLRQDPSPALVLLEPLRADPSRYVQDSVANWLNDAGKDRPDWTRALCERWMQESPDDATRRICRRGARSL
jgi:3-methyladenine DNA glycosylase AlkC